jgi:hypothetical protein
MLREQIGADYDHMDKFVATLGTATGQVRQDPIDRRAFGLNIQAPQGHTSTHRLSPGQKRKLAGAFYVKCCVAVIDSQGSPA